MTIEQDFNLADNPDDRRQIASVPPDRFEVVSTLLKKLSHAINAHSCTVLELQPGATHFTALPKLYDLEHTAFPATLLGQMVPEGSLTQVSASVYSILIQGLTSHHRPLILAFELPHGVILGEGCMEYLREATALLQLICARDTDADSAASSGIDQVDHGEAGGALTRLTEAQALIVDLINAMLQAPFDRVDKTIDRALAQLGMFCGSDRTYLFVENNADTMSNTHEWCAADIAPMKDELQDVPRDMADMWWTIFDTHGHVYIENVAKLEPQSDLRAILEMQGIISLLAVPLQMDGRAVGFMGYDAVRSRRSFLPGEIYLLKSIANVIATLLSRRADEEKAREERQYRENEQRKLQATLRAMPDILLELDPDLRVTGIHANPQIVLPIAPENLLGYTIEQCMPSHIVALANDIKTELQTKDIAMGYRCALSVNGAQKWFSVSAAKREAESGGRPFGYVVVVRDTTESYTQQLEIERLSTIARNSTNLVLITDPTGRIEWVNPAFERRTGYQLHEIRGMSPGQLLQCPLTDENTVSQIRAALSQEQAITCEILNQTKWGELYWVELAIQPLFDDQSELTGFMSVQTDMTQHRLHARSMERALTAEKEARDQLKSAVSIMQDAFIQFDKNQKLTLCNAQYRMIFSDMTDVLQPGRSLEEVLRASIGLGYWEIAEDDIESWLEREVSAFNLHYTAAENMNIRGRWYRHVQQTTPDGGRISVLSDITDLKDAERRALADRARAMDASRDGIVLMSDAGFVTYANIAAIRMLGLEDEQDLGRFALADLVTLKTNGGNNNQDLSRAFKKPNWTGEVCAVGQDGEPVEIEISTSRNSDRSILCILRDQTLKLKAVAEKETLREALALAQRREEMGQIAAGLTHDFNNFLAVISSAATLIEEAGEIEGRALAGRISETVDQASDLVRRLMDLGKQKNTEKVQLDLRTPVRDAVALLRPGLRPWLQLDLSLPDTPVNATADSISVVQVVMNLCINARDAILEASAQTGRIGVAMRPAEPADYELPFQIGTLNPDHEYICLTVTDTGPGMPPEVLERVFTPYFSTKGEKGTGLGLQIVASAIQTHSGAISLVSTPENGTCFTILWPVLGETEHQDKAFFYPELEDKSILLLGTGSDRERALINALEKTGALAVPCIDAHEARAVLEEAPDLWDAVIVHDSFSKEIEDFEVFRIADGKENVNILYCFDETSIPNEKIASDTPRIDLSHDVGMSLEFLASFIK